MQVLMQTMDIIMRLEGRGQTGISLTTLMLLRLAHHWNSFLVKLIVISLTQYTFLCTLILVLLRPVFKIRRMKYQKIL